MNDDQTTPVVAPVPTRSRTRIAFYGATLLLCGTIIGAGIMATVLWERLQHSVRDPKRMPERIVDDMREGLALSEDQADQIEAIIERHRDEFEAIRSEMEPRIQGHMDQVNAEIKQVLTPQQREEWERRFVKERHRWSGPPGAWGPHDRIHGRPPGGPHSGPPGDQAPPPPPPGPFPEGGE